MLGVLMVLIFILQFLSLIRYLGLQTFRDHCPPNSNGCIRVNKFNQYRANNIEMQYPVTFKEQTLDVLVYDWVNDFTNNRVARINLEVSNNTQAQEEARKNNQTVPSFERYFYFYHATWYGLIIDTLVTVHECSQVFKAQTVTMQSQTRVGFKDYGYNYEISTSFYKSLNTKVTKEGLKSFISCT